MMLSCTTITKTGPIGINEKAETLHRRVHRNRPTCADDGRAERKMIMFNINDAVGWISNIAVFSNREGGYILVDWPFSWKTMTIH